MWVGGTDADSEGSFVWSHSGLAMTYTDWQPGQPDHGTNADCVLLITGTRRWHDVGCTQKRPSICEFSSKFGSRLSTLKLKL